MMGCWDAPGDYGAGLELGGGSPGEAGGCFPPGGMLQGDIGHPHLQETEVSPLPRFSLLKLLNHSVSLGKVSASPWGYRDGKQ